MSNDPAPVPSNACARHDFHASFHHSQRLLEESSRRRPAPEAGPEAAGSLNLWKTRDGVTPAASVTTTTKTTATPAAAAAPRSSRRLHASVNPRRRSSRDNKYAAPKATTPPSTSASANSRPSCTCADRGCPSFVSAGRENDHPPTASVGTAATATTNALS